MPETSAGAARPAPPGDFGAMAEHVAPRLYRIALRMCRNEADAEDLVQDTLLLAFKKWDQFEGRSDPATWLYTIAARQCRRRHRRRSGEPARLESLSELLPSAADPVLVMPVSNDGPFDAHLRKEAERTIADAISHLPASVRLPLVLADIAELTTPEIARVLGLKEATVKTRIHRARLRIRRALLEQLPVRPAPPGDHERQVCLDLLQAKQEAIDRRVAFPFSGDALCGRCQALFATLDLGRDVCGVLGQGALPDRLRRILDEHGAPAPPRPQRVG